MFCCMVAIIYSEVSLLCILRPIEHYIPHDRQKLDPSHPYDLKLLSFSCKTHSYHQNSINADSIRCCPRQYPPALIPKADLAPLGN